MIEFFNRLRDESGQTMAEYAVVLGVITIAVVVTLGLLSTKFLEWMALPDTGADSTQSRTRAELPVEEARRLENE